MISAWWMLPVFISGIAVGIFLIALVSANTGKTEAVSMNENRCVCCGAIIPEGRQVCPTCEEGVTGCAQPDHL